MVTYVVKYVGTDDVNICVHVGMLVFLSVLSRYGVQKNRPSAKVVLSFDTKGCSRPKSSPALIAQVSFVELLVMILRQYLGLTRCAVRMNVSIVEGRIWLGRDQPRNQRLSPPPSPPILKRHKRSYKTQHLFLLNSQHLCAKGV